VTIGVNDGREVENKKAGRELQEQIMTGMVYLDTEIFMNYEWKASRQKLKFSSNERKWPRLCGQLQQRRCMGIID
jgi:hypothetical protein